ncbi:hypothetical protein ACFRI7_37540 [Streptomyces sp. NPDC056716]
MENNETREDSATVLDELESLEVVEASELEEGAAFHAFRFAI